MKTKASEYSVGDPVTYVPHHAHGDVNHPDCEQGHVSTIKEGIEDRIWVRFKAATGACCDIANIR